MPQDPILHCPYVTRHTLWPLLPNKRNFLSRFGQAQNIGNKSCGLTGVLLFDVRIVASIVSDIAHSRGTLPLGDIATAVSSETQRRFVPAWKKCIVWGPNKTNANSKTLRFGCLVEMKASWGNRPCDAMLVTICGAQNWSRWWDSFYIR